MRRAGWARRRGRKELEAKPTEWGKSREGKAGPVSHVLRGSKVGSGRKEERGRK